MVYLFNSNPFLKGIFYGYAIVKPAGKHLNNVILSDAKNLAFSSCYEILHSVQDDHYNCRVNNLIIIKAENAFITAISRSVFEIPKRGMITREGINAPENEPIRSTA